MGRNKGNFMREEITVDELCEYTNRLEEIILKSVEIMESIIEDYQVLDIDDFLEIIEVVDLRDRLEDFNTKKVDYV